MNYLKLTKDVLELTEINNLVVDESCGAVSFFVGTTRDNFDGKKVVCLEYEAYEPMALKIMEQICDEIRVKWPDIKNIAIYHRLEVVPVKEASVIIAISSPHRQSSLDGVQYGIETLKKLVPIWKKEQYENHSSSWKENKECKPSTSKKPKLNFNDCIQSKDSLTKNLCQITTNDNEIKRRINCFIQKKREEINVNNILDFISTNNYPNINQESSCARVNSVLIKKKDSKGHLKVHQVKNEYGPEECTSYTRVLDKLVPIESLEIKKEKTENRVLPFGIMERLENVETYLNVNEKSCTKDIYERLKIIENRILYLESISPEYASFLGKTGPLKEKIKSPTHHRKKTYSIEELDSHIKRLQNKISAKLNK